MFQALLVSSCDTDSPQAYSLTIRLEPLPKVDRFGCNLPYQPRWDLLSSPRTPRAMKGEADHHLHLRPCEADREDLGC